MATVALLERRLMIDKRRQRLLPGPVTHRTVGKSQSGLVTNRIVGKSHSGPLTHIGNASENVLSGAMKYKNGEKSGSVTSSDNGVFLHRPVSRTNSELITRAQRPDSGTVLERSHPQDIPYKQVH